MTMKKKQTDLGVLVVQLDPPRFKSCASCEHWSPQRRAGSTGGGHIACQKLGVTLAPRIPKARHLVVVLSRRCCPAYSRNPFVVPAPGEGDDSGTILDIS